MSILAKRNATIGALFALTGALLFGLNASTSKVLIQSGIDAGVLVLYRSFATAALAGALLLFTNRRAFRVKLREVPMLMLFGVVGVALMQWSYSQAVANLQVGIALLIEYTAIIWVPLAGWIFFRKKLKPRIWLAIALVLGGLAIVANVAQSTLNPSGVLFAFLAAIFLTLYFIVGERIQRTRDTLSTLFYTMLISAIFWMIFSTWTSFDFSKITHDISLMGNFAQTQIPLWVLLALIAVFGSFIPMLLSYRALHHLSATGVGIASTSETIFALLFGYLWLAETATGTQLVGSLFVVIGIVLAQTAKTQREELT